MTDPQAPAPAWDAAERVLRERAERLARGDDHAELGARADTLAFRVGAERYAVELSRLWSIHPARGLAPVPCVPPHVAGMLNVRGEIVTVLDFGVVLGARSATSREPGAPVLLAELPGIRVGLLVDEVLAAERLDLGALEPTLSGREYARGVAEGRTVLLDLPKLLTDERFEVAEEVS